MQRMPHAVRAQSGRCVLRRDRRVAKLADAVHGWGLWGAGLCWLSLVFVAGGATCARRQTIAELQPPVVFSTQPTHEQVINRINRSLNLTSFESNNLTVSGPDLPTKLSGNMKWERPHNFKLEAYLGTKLMGTALAAGSNSEMFWMQTQSPPTVYYARYDEFEAQPGPRHILPVSPLWLREALGVVEMDPELIHQEPIVRPDGDLEIRSLIPSPRGPYRRHLVLDPSTCVIKQTMLYNHVGKLVAVAQQSEHEYYSAIDYNLPHRVDIQLQPDEGPAISFTVEVGFFLLNQPTSQTPEEFRVPDTRGLSTVNLAQANSMAGGLQATPPAYQAAAAGVHGTSSGLRTDGGLPGPAAKYTSPSNLHPSNGTQTAGTLSSYRNVR
ncbi:MAG: hypothetical protein NXI32_11595 [bacterium]|nr:hypothetical protein [bacterium]